MKKTQPHKARRTVQNEMATEYRFDYRKARPNRFAGRIADKQVVVLLESDLAEHFPTAKAVNRALRQVLRSQPSRRKTASSSR